MCCKVFELCQAAPAVRAFDESQMAVRYAKVEGRPTTEDHRGKDETRLSRKEARKPSTTTEMSEADGKLAASKATARRRGEKGSAGRALISSVCLEEDVDQGRCKARPAV